MDRVIIFDTETGADIAAARTLLGPNTEDLTGPEARRLLRVCCARDGAAPATLVVKPALHKIVALSMAIFSRASEEEPWRFYGVPSRHVGNITAAEIVSTLHRHDLRHSGAEACDH